MQLVICNSDLQSYVEETSIINFSHPKIEEKIREFQKVGKTKQERAEAAFCFVRDDIQHSFDISSDLITISASDTLEHREGICFAKAHLLAAFLRGMGIPTGFCYQRVTRKGTPDSGYALHGLNAVYFDDIDKWFRVDPRGNKPGVTSEFSIAPEKLAYPIRTELGEIDYPYVYSEPLENVVVSMQQSVDCKELFFKRPEQIL
ncbi:transglutaminase-like domain-containing protein [Ferdinandcohnia quinoae]|uniref:Transglutaminase family protein n=1 Tax=Fredinandcohnia quinoae TaxID=2918902 RepID=A0AAW5E0A3_9BACI|nr:transglutaminase family protein [Fredinandcohnia sp. SECRCQ15]MCH1624094.1 transglutaminase family protein [Fredinandcohnia sp. SECRCQ15]